LFSGLLTKANAKAINNLSIMHVHLIETSQNWISHTRLPLEFLPVFMDNISLENARHQIYSKTCPSLLD